MRKKKKVAKLNDLGRGLLKSTAKRLRKARKLVDATKKRRNMLVRR